MLAIFYEEEDFCHDNISGQKNSDNSLDIMIIILKNSAI